MIHHRHCEVVHFAVLIGESVDDDPNSSKQ